MKNILILILVLFVMYLLNRDKVANDEKNIYNGNNTVQHKERKESSHDNNYNNKKKDIDINKEYKVDRVVDGDTVIANINNFRQRIRIIGINTPESHNINGRIIECFGKEAEKKAKKILENKKIFIETDGSQDIYDKHGRLLAHIFYEENGKKINFGLKMIEDGYAYEFTYRLPYKYQKEYKKAQKNAKKNMLGLWDKNNCK